jgi:hypothetical protein
MLGSRYLFFKNWCRFVGYWIFSSDLPITEFTNYEFFCCVESSHVSISINFCGKIDAMNFENKCFSELLKIARAGLGFTLNAPALSNEELHQLIEAAAESGAQLKIIQNSVIEPTEFIQNGSIKN